MNKTRELTIHNTLWKDATELVNLRDFISSKLAIKTQYNAKYDLTDYYVEYNGGGFWWLMVVVIDDLKGYYDFSNGVSFLNLLFKSEEQKNQYDRPWGKIVSISGSSGLIKDSTKTRLNSDDLSLGHEFKINTVTIVVTMVVEKDNKFYPQISLNYCSYG